MLEAVSLLTVAILFGGMVLYSFGFAAFLFSALPSDVARSTLRSAFPHFYLFVMGLAGVAAVMLWFVDGGSALLMAAVAVTTVPTRQVLMPAINRATDAGNKSRFKVLHGLSVLITLAHMGVAGVVLARFV